MDRRAWTDERIDDMAARHDTDIQVIRAEIREGFDRMDDGFDRLRAQMFQAVLVLSGAMVATMVTIIAKTL